MNRGLVDEHKCLMPDCKVKIRDRYLMCRAHWALVPTPLAMEIWREYFHGRRQKKHPTEEYTKAVRTAIRVVLEKVVQRGRS